MKSIREVEKIASSREQKLTELSGREKRALAAERRLATQLPSDTAIVRYTHAHAHTHTILSCHYRYKILKNASQDLTYCFLGPDYLFNNVVHATV